MTKYNVEFAKNFDKSFSKLDKTVQKQIKDVISNFLNNAKNVDLIKLKGHKDYYRIRSGNYRIILKKYDDLLLIVFVDVKHRREVYKDL